jgi:hypothetical protein
MTEHSPLWSIGCDHDGIVSHLISDGFEKLVDDRVRDLSEHVILDFEDGYWNVSVLIVEDHGGEFYLSEFVAVVVSYDTKVPPDIFDELE